MYTAVIDIHPCDADMDLPYPRFKDGSHYVVAITWAQDMMVDNSPSSRVQPEDEEYFFHNI